MIDRIRVRMLERVDSLAEGEVVNLPSVLADKLMAQGKAKAIEGVKTMVQPSENKAITPASVKVAKPAEKKSSTKAKETR